MAKFTKNDERINRSGRPPGSKNVLCLDLKSDIHTFLMQKWPLLQKNFDKLDPTQQHLYFEKYLRYILPTQKETDLNLTLDRLTDNQVDQLLNEIFKKAPNEISE